MSDTATLTKPAPAKAEKTNILNALDRCDSCGAAAFVRIKLRVSERLPEGGELQFCGHHYDKLEASLVSFVDGEPIDERHKLVFDRHTGTENS